MAFLIGTDEAGYGPNLGPLVISATVWHVPTAKREVDLYKLLSKIVYAPETPAGNGLAKLKAESRLAVADSKALYKSGSTVELLERGVLACLAATGGRPDTWRELCDLVDGDCRDAHAGLPWLCDFDLPLPYAQPAAAIEEVSQRLLEGCHAAGVACRAIRSRIVHPPDFNRLTDEQGNKSNVLTEQSLALLTCVLADLPDEPIFVVCDKHGGRNVYSRALQCTFPDYLVEIRKEGRAESRYVFGPSERRVQVSFKVSGERFLPSALASMTSKYLRELCMRGLNDFWQRHVPGVKATAGYAVDARRFKQDIAARQDELGIADTLLWRAR